MEGDRGAALIVQAARTGAIDFSKARLLDRHWWLKTKLLIDDLERDNLSKVFRLRQAQHLAAVLVPNLKDDSFDTHWTGSQDALGKFTELLFPWYGDMSAKAMQQRNMRSMADSWKTVWGDPADPKVAARIQAVAAEMMARYNDKVKAVSSGPSRSRKRAH